MWVIANRPRYVVEPVADVYVCEVLVCHFYFYINRQHVFFFRSIFTIILFKALGQCDSRPLSIDFVRFYIFDKSSLPIFEGKISFALWYRFLNKFKTIVLRACRSYMNDLFLFMLFFHFICVFAWVAWMTAKQHASECEFKKWKRHLENRKFKVHFFRG